MATIRITHSDPVSKSNNRDRKVNARKKAKQAKRDAIETHAETLLERVRKPI